MQSVVESLDMKIGRCRDAKAKEMCLEVVEGEDSTRSKLDGLPEWATELLIDFDSTPVYVHVLTVFILLVVHTNLYNILSYYLKSRNTTCK